MKRILTIFIFKLFLLLSFATYGFATDFGIEQQDNSDLSGTGGIAQGAGVVIGDIAEDWRVAAFSGATITASKTGGDAQNISAVGNSGNLFELNTASFVLGSLYLAEITLSSVTGSVNWRVMSVVATNIQFERNIGSNGTFNQFFISDATFNGTNFFQAMAGESFTVSEASIKKSRNNVIFIMQQIMRRR